jgi:predicted Rossmann-fold nucleotide-binding protein
MRLLVCGGRDYSDADRLSEVLDRVLAKHKITCVIHGGATGADELAHHWAINRGLEIEVFHAAWNREGHSAGPRRNARMLAEGKPDVAVAFPGGRGTADMVWRLNLASVAVWEIAI